MAHPRFSGVKDRSIVTIGVTAALLSLPLAAPIVAAVAGSPLQPLRLEKDQLLGVRSDVRPVSRPVAVVDKTTGRLIDPKTGTAIDRTKAVLDPATGALIDPVTGAIIPSDAPVPSSLAGSAPGAAKSSAASSQKSVLPAGAPATRSLPAPQPAAAGGSDLLPADQMVVGVVDEVLGASSDDGTTPLTPLLGDRKSSDDASASDDASSGSSSHGSSSDESAPARSSAKARTAPAPKEDARTVGPAGGTDAVEVRPGALSSAPVGGTSGVPHLLGAPAFSGLRSSQSYFPQPEPEAPQVSVPTDLNDSSLVALGDLTTSEPHLATGQVTATSLPNVINESPSWLVSTASGLLLVVGGTSVVYGGRRLRRRTA